MLTLIALVALTPLPNAHAHNDYVQPRPLVGALALGFCSIEVDVFPVGDKLLVGHDRGDLTPRRDLDKMYLRPLAERMRRNGGSVYGTADEVILLVDIKEDGERSYRLLKPLLQKYGKHLSRFEHGKVLKKGLRVILSGLRPIATIEAETTRMVFVDGRPQNLEGAGANLFPLVSAAWPSVFRWRGDGEFTEREKLVEMVQKAHVRGQKLRFWATPENPHVWRELRAAGVDLIGTDRQGELSTFLRTR